MIIVDPEEGEHADVVRSLDGVARLGPLAANPVVENGEDDGDDQDGAKGEGQVEPIEDPSLAVGGDPFDKRRPL